MSCLDPSQKRTDMPLKARCLENMTEQHATKLAAFIPQGECVCSVVNHECVLCVYESYVYIKGNKPSASRGFLHS